jgi:hypothetical protein
VPSRTRIEHLLTKIGSEEDRKRIRILRSS